LRINKPCKFEGLAKSWPAFDKWRFEDNGPEYLTKKFGDLDLAIVVDSATDDGNIWGDSGRMNKI
jgi:hypothetical protein